MWCHSGRTSHYMRREKLLVLVGVYIGPNLRGYFSCNCSVSSFRFCDVIDLRCMADGCTKLDVALSAVFETKMLHVMPIFELTYLMCSSTSYDIPLNHAPLNCISFVNIVFPSFDYIHRYIYAYTFE